MKTPLLGLLFAGMLTAGMNAQVLDITLDVSAPACTSSAVAGINGKVNTANDVAKLTIAGEDGVEKVIGENLGPNPTFSTFYILQNTDACGPNRVTITAIDSNGGKAARTVTILHDGNPPVIQCPANLTVMTSAPLEGAAVNFAVEATDDCAPKVTVVCVPASGSVFPFGETIVQCSATDDCGNESVCSFKVTVVEGVANLPPTIQCPADIKTICQGDRGTRVEYAVLALDDHDFTPKVVCTPPSGSDFPVGTTVVECVATDSQGASSRCSFNVTVDPAQISIRKTVTIEWCGGGTLQYADSLDGTWTSIPGVTSPYTVDVDEAHRYYRAQF